MGAGYSLIELMFVAALGVTLAGISIPQALSTLDDMRAAGAARYVSTRLHRTRMEAIMRSADVAMRFTATPAGYTFAMYVDGNRDGVRTRDIRRGLDRPLGQPERLGDSFAGVDFGTFPQLPPVDPAGVPPGADPIRLGTSDLATFTARGTSTTGSLYIRGRHQGQYVIRIFGDTAKTRILKFDPRAKQWKPL